MAEAYPSSGTLDALDGTTDASLALEYVPKNTKPTDSPTLAQKFNRLLQRLFRTVTPAGQGRVGQSDAGNLKVIVYAIDYVLGGAQKSFATADNQTVADNTTNYVYLNSANALVINNTGFPADITTFVPLATVVTSGGVITAFNDKRGFMDHVVAQNTSTGTTGTSNQSWMADNGNGAGAGRDVQFRAERGTDNAEDAAMEWQASGAKWRARSQHSTNTLSPMDASKYQVAGVDAIDTSGYAQKVGTSAVDSTKGLSSTTGVASVKTASASGTGVDGSGNLAVTKSDGIALDANGAKVSLTSNGGLKFTGATPNGTLGVQTDAATVEVDGATGNVRLKDNGTTGAKFANNDVNGSGHVIFKATLSAGNTVTIHNANSPFKYEVIDAWSRATSGAGGTWKVDDGANPITDVVTVTAVNQTINRAGKIDGTKNTIAVNGTLRVVGDGASATAVVYVEAIRVS